MPPMIQVAYVAHPVGDDAEFRAVNLLRAERWIRWLVLQEDGYAYECSWIGYVRALHGLDARSRGLRDDRIHAEACNGIVLVGGHVSPGMRIECDTIRRAGGWVSDLTELGEEPPRERYAWLGPDVIAYGREVWRHSAWLLED